MFPITLDVARLPIMLVGNGMATLRRLELLDDAGAPHVTLFADAPSDALRTQAGERLIEHLPEMSDYALVAVVMIADFDESTSGLLAEEARNAGKLVNVEDKRPYCDFHVPAIVRRGDLLLTISTNAKSPRLARRLRQWLQQVFPPSWAGIVNEIGEKRLKWKQEGASFEELAKNTDALIESRGWFAELDKVTEDNELDKVA